MKRFLIALSVITLMLWFLDTQLAGAAGQDGKLSAVSLKDAEKSTGKSVDAADFVGSETCSTCHAEVLKSFAGNPHAKLAMLHGGKGITCEGCHGPGKAHVESGGDATKIFRFSQATAKQVDATCLGCHEQAHPNFERSPHGEAGVGCTSCHRVHASGNDLSLLKAPQPGLCYTCHTSTESAFALPFHHQVDEGLMKCSDCHDTHGTFKRKQLRTTAEENANITRPTIATAAYSPASFAAKKCFTSTMSQLLISTWPAKKTIA